MLCDLVDIARVGTLGVEGEETLLEVVAHDDGVSTELLRLGRVVLGRGAVVNSLPFAAKDVEHFGREGGKDGGVGVVMRFRYGCNRDLMRLAAGTEHGKQESDDYFLSIIHMIIGAPKRALIVEIGRG